MKKITINKTTVVILFCILVGSTFLLSTIGKYFDLIGFQRTMIKYGLPYYASYIILSIEALLAICFMFHLFLKQVASFSIAFIILMTIINTIGHYFLNIESCECFGRIYFLNPKSFNFFLIKNIILVLILFYIYMNIEKIQNRVLLKKIITVLITLLTVFISFKYNTYYVENYTEKKIGLTTDELNISKGKVENFNYLFFFSTSCVHCKEAIPKINLLKEKYSIDIIGITSNSKEAELKKIASELKINFPITTVDRKVFNDVTLLVPVIFKIKNNKVEQILEVKELLSKKSF
jgi:thiol-disulfide isomerase/thioredoxin